MAAPRARLSVVVPTHDTRDLTLRCLASLAPGDADELIVVDDGSRDGTAAAVAAAHPRARLLRSEQARGFSAAANQGLRAASGELLWLLNSDTEAPPDAPAALRAAFAARPRLGAASPQLEDPDGAPQWTGGRLPSLAWLLALGTGLPAWLNRRRGRRAAPGGDVDWVTGAALCLRREAWQACGPLDEGYRFYGQDLELCWRLGAAGWRVAVLAELRVRHHGGATIGRQAGALGGQHPELLYADLVRCIGRCSGATAGRRAGLALRAGTSLRLMARGLRAAFLGPDRRDRFEQDSAALRAARRALAAPAAGAE